MTMKLFLYALFMSLMLTMAWNDHEDCWTGNNMTITKKYAVLINFTPALHPEKETCSIDILNPWIDENQNGFGIFPTRPIDCSLVINIECLPNGTSLQQTRPSPVQYTCNTKTYKVEMPCNLIRLTYQRNPNMNESRKSIDIQVVALAKEPCKDDEILFQCPSDYPHSCLNRKLQCNSRSECPSSDDERDCQQPSPAGVPIIVIVLAVLAFLALICILSTVLVCLCCRAAFHAIIQRLCPGRKHRSLEKGELPVVTGEDAGLMKGLTTPSVITTLPGQRDEPATLVIDSTKPVYPRLE